MSDHSDTKVEEVKGLVGETLGPSEWMTISQEQVSGFADLSGDHNPIHLDVEYAKGTPFGGTIVHGYFTLALVVPMMAEYFNVTDASTSINYGLDKLRFPAPVPVGSKVRASSVITAVDDVPGGVQAHVTTTIEVEGGTKPVAVAEMLLRYYA